MIMLFRCTYKMCSVSEDILQLFNNSKFPPSASVVRGLLDVAPSGPGEMGLHITYVGTQRLELDSQYERLDPSFSPPRPNPRFLLSFPVIPTTHFHLEQISSKPGTLRHKSKSMHHIGVVLCTVMTKL
jgi:hypothetical protein